MMNIFQMMQNPQQLVSQLMNKATTPMQKNALDLISNGDDKAVEQMVRNICKERNINVNQAMSNLQKNFAKFK